MNERLLRIVDVQKAVGFGKSKIYNLIRAGMFPAGIRVGWKTAVWPESWVQAWIAGRIAERDATAKRTTPPSAA